MNVINDDILEGQIPEYQPEEQKPKVEQQKQPETKEESMIGKKISFMPGSHDLSEEEKERLNAMTPTATKLGENVLENVEAREGWIMIDKSALGERVIFYPKDWQFKVRPATVEAIRNWSTIDDQNANSIDDALNEILKSCLSIHTSRGPLPWGNLRSWDRFFFINLIHEYTFVQGEHKVEYEEDCPNCENPVKFVLHSSKLLYDMPDKDVMKYFDEETQTWLIDPEEFGIAAEPITLYLPTLEKDMAIKTWLINRIQEKKKVDNVFIKFLLWMAPKISKDETIAARQIKEYEMKFKAWNTEMFSFMNDVINNITVMPTNKLVTVCPICGEEVTSEIQFQNGIRDLFTVSSGYKKFGTK
jgi:hypothetical protein